MGITLSRINIYDFFLFILNFVTKILKYILKENYESVRTISNLVHIDGAVLCVKWNVKCC